MIMTILEILGGTERKVAITQKSPFSGEMNTVEMFLDISDFYDWREGRSIQHAMPYLSADEREFLMTGITAEEWDTTFT